MIRRFQFILLSFITFFLIISTIGCTSSPSGPTGQFPRKVLIESLGIEYMDYLLFIPSDYYKEETKRWPMILFLHGAGGRGGNVEMLRKVGVSKLVEEDKDFPFIVVSPLCPADRYWVPAVLKKLLDDVCRELRVDMDRIYLTGLSMGGYGTWYTAIKYPDVFAAIAPICGGGDPYRACRLADMPVWVFHGAKDTTVSPQESIKMVEALKDCNENVKFTLYPELGHDCWTETYNNPELYQWFLEQSKANH
ncbi:MAG TPA: prolyl oligopeptidase family serine peptidase [Candidatus Hydromicrobium sp.]